MEALLKRRSSIRKKLLRMETEQTTLLQANPINRMEVMQQWKDAEEVYFKLVKLEEEVVDKLQEADASEEQFEAEDLGREKFEKAFRKMRTSVEQLMANQEASEYGDARSNHGNRKKFRLPKIELPVFDGQLKSWLSWWSQFEKIDGDDAIDDADKFGFLMQSVAAGSDAHRIISSYPRTGNNYKLAIADLKENYGQEDLQLQVYVRELLQLVISNVNSKDKFPLSQLCTTLESHLRSLEELQLQSADPAVWLFPLVESSLPEDTLRAWQHSPMSSVDGSKQTPPKSRLDLLREFMKAEVKNEQRISLAKTGFQSSSSSSVQPKDKFQRNDRVRKGKISNEDVRTAAGLLSTSSAKICVFCDKPHESDRCIKAQSWTCEKKQSICQKKKACFRCLRSGHFSKDCRTPVKCAKCGGQHYAVMCSKAESANAAQPIPQEDIVVGEKVQQTVSHECTPSILLNTIRVNLVGEEGKSYSIRLVGDTGSQRSYITSDAVQRGKPVQVGEEFLQNIVFGGKLSPLEKHGKYDVVLKPLQMEMSPRYHFDLLAKRELCGRITSVPEGPWIDELKEKKIVLTDVGGSSSEVQILLGNDYWPHIITGKILRLDCGLVATETVFGWTLGGRLPQSSLATTVLSMMAAQTDVNKLWDLETIGTTDPIIRKTEADLEKEAFQHFVKNVKRDEDGRYIVALPWNGNEADLPSNYAVSAKRLENATAKFKNQAEWMKYDEVFRQWEKEGLIDEVDGVQKGHFLPHRPVFKDSLTTPVRPVFDASCRVRNHPSLNECLAKGPNLIELIPVIMLRFQEKAVGVSADIRKAFQMIRVRDQDQPYQKFLWWKDADCKEMKIFQHDRVVFGLNCSPFLLGATIKYHLDTHKDQFAAEMKNKFYVDNFLTSVSSHEEYEDIRRKATAIMQDGRMELREWTSSSQEGQGNEKEEISVLGIVWNTSSDTLRCAVKKVDTSEPVTKRGILSAVAKQFDPMGYLAPVLLQAKILLQKTWEQKLDWKTKIEGPIADDFRKWASSLPGLNALQLPRHVKVGDECDMQIHIFSDASQDAYAAAVFLRTENSTGVKVQLLIAKTRLAPLEKDKTRKDEQRNIPRLELLGCLIATRLAVYVREALGADDIPYFYWSDSSVALAWIQRDGDWGVFVRNRVKQIRSVTNPEQWSHVPGPLNPADLISRGCTPQQMLESRWWEGPGWLSKGSEHWPKSLPDYDEEEIEKERTKTVTMNSNVRFVMSLPQLSSYRMNVAVLAWMLRFAKKGNQTKQKFLTLPELRRAEVYMLKMIQAEAFPDSDVGTAKINVFEDEMGVLRVKTRISNREDQPGFLFPILLPKSHPMVDLLVQDFHRHHGHGGTNFIREKLREKYWIIQSRRVVSKVLNDCVDCRRHSVQSFPVDPAPLPKKRISDCDPFTSTGVDLAGPVSLTQNEKGWIVLYTCAVYRCVHLDLVTSLSTETFLKSLERFIALYGRPNTVFSDNGTNFTGAANLFRRLDWEEVKELLNVKQIQWIFNPPTAAWWGGWWEKLIRSVKDLLKRQLGRAKLSAEEMRTCLAGVAATINDRPLTIVTEDGGDLHPLSPSMFIRPMKIGVFPELEQDSSLSKRYQTMKRIQKQLQERFRKEYLALLVMPKKKTAAPVPELGDVVLIGSDNKRRFEWPLGRIVELFFGKDGKIRVAKVKTETGFLTRPVQRLYPMEVSKSSPFQKPSIVQEAVALSTSFLVQASLEPSIAKDGEKNEEETEKPGRYAQWIHLVKNELE